MNDEVYEWHAAKITPWPFVYRMTWLVATVEEGNKSWTRRVTEKAAREWQRCFEGNRDYRLSKGQDWNEKLVIERAPVGDWETVYEGDPMTTLEYQQVVGGG